MKYFSQIVSLRWRPKLAKKQSLHTDFVFAYYRLLQQEISCKLQIYCLIWVFTACIGFKIHVHSMWAIYTVIVLKIQNLNPQKRERIIILIIIIILRICFLKILIGFQTVYSQIWFFFRSSLMRFYTVYQCIFVITRYF